MEGSPTGYNICSVTLSLTLTVISLIVFTCGSSPGHRELPGRVQLVPLQPCCFGPRLGLGSLPVLCWSMFSSFYRRLTAVTQQGFRFVVVYSSSAPQPTLEEPGLNYITQQPVGCSPLTSSLVSSLPTYRLILCYYLFYTLILLFNFIIYFH